MSTDVDYLNAERRMRNFAVWSENPKVVLDEHGTVIAGQPCQSCEGVTYGETCPYSLTCPSCHQRPGQRCRRPSEHLADQMHRDRWELAHKIDDEAGTVRRYRKGGRP